MSSEEMVAYFRTYRDARADYLTVVKERAYNKGKMKAKAKPLTLTDEQKEQIELLKGLGIKVTKKMMKEMASK